MMRETKKKRFSAFKIARAKLSKTRGIMKRER